MAIAKRLAPSSDGYDKKHDLPRHKSNTSRSMYITWPALRRRRVLLGLVATALIILFIRNIPTDVPSVGARYNAQLGSLASGHTQAQSGLLPSNGRPAGRGADASSNAPTIYDGPVRLNGLAGSLRSFVSRPSKDNILFAVLDLESATRLLPLACKMASMGRAHVHVAMMGQQDASVEEVMEINGLSISDCMVIWHDARPDYPMRSLPERIQSSVEVAMTFLEAALHPQLVFMDDMNERDRPITSMMEKMADRLRISLVQLPTNAHDSLDWLSTLDARSLAHFPKVEISIVIQAYTESSGSLIRLLRSIKSANYDGLPIPEITIELPAKVDPYLKQYLSRFEWKSSSKHHTNQLHLRHLLDQQKVRPADALLHTVQSFYSASPSTSHVLVLSPEVQLSPSYYHYLMYTVLEYKYGVRGEQSAADLFGVSLDLPHDKLDGSTPFLPTSITKSGPLILSQTPNSRAALYFGQHWNDLHTFLSERLARDPTMTAGLDFQGIPVSKQYPVWLNMALEMMQATGLYMLYPTFAKADGHSIAVVHQDLSKTPEEYDEPVKAVPPTELDLSNILKDNSLTIDVSSIPAPGAEDTASYQTSMQELMSLTAITNNIDQAFLPDLRLISMFSPAGELVDVDESATVASQFADKFSLTLGGCSSLARRDQSKEGSVDYLFCEPG